MLQVQNRNFIFDFRSRPSGEAAKVLHIMLAQSRPLIFRTNRRQQPAPKMARISLSPRNSHGPGFQRASQRVGKKNGCVEMFVPRFSHGGDHFVHIRLPLPELGQFGMREKSEMTIGTSLPDGAQSRDGKNGVAQPVGAADQKTKGFEVATGRHMDAATIRAQ